VSVSLIRSNVTTRVNRVVRVNNTASGNPRFDIETERGIYRTADDQAAIGKMVDDQYKMPNRLVEFTLDNKARVTGYTFSN
jgi:hypothetical protein